MVPPLIIHNLHVKFEIDQENCSLYVLTRQITTDTFEHGVPKLTLTFDPW